MLQRPVYQTAIALLTLAAFAGAVFLIASPKAPPGMELTLPPPNAPTGPVASPDALAVSDSPSAAADGRININVASVAELMTLDGIGITLAQRIVDYREAHGPYLRTDQLLAIERLGPVTYDRIRDLVTVGD